MNTDVSLHEKVGTSTSSSPKEEKKYGHGKHNLRYNSSHSQVDYVSDKHEKSACLNGRKSCCSYCGLCNHEVSKCWKRMKAYKKQLKQRKLSQKVQKTCTHCQEKGHVIAQHWKLHPTKYPKNLKQEDRNTGKIGTKYSIVDVRMNVSHQEYLHQQNSLWKCLSKKWFDLLRQ